MQVMKEPEKVFCNLYNFMTPLPEQTNLSLPTFQRIGSGLALQLHS